MEEQKQQEITVKRLLSSVKLNADVSDPKPVIQEDLTKVEEDAREEDRFLSGLAAVLLNIDREEGRFDKGKIQELISQIDAIIEDQVNEIIHHPLFKEMESTWRSIHHLVMHTNFRANVMLDILDVSKEELFEDFEENAANLVEGALFRKVYVAEYDQFGGKPYGVLLGLYDFEHTPDDLFWLRQMARVAAASHAPFIGAVSPKFFGCQTIEELASIKDLEGLLNQPKYGDWNAFRDTPEAAYVGLTLPRFMLRKPWHPETNPCREIHFTERVRGDNNEDYLWGYSSVLLVRNMIRSFEETGWCQYIRGPKGGGLITGLPVHTFNIRGEEEIKIPVEFVIPDYRELEFANCGFIPLIYQKGTANACFFSVQSVKKAKKFKDPKDTENAQLVTNLAYTMSVCRIAHYVKSMMRDNIGSNADAAYIKRQLENWIMQYVTTVVNPDDLTLRYYPFKAAQVEVVERPGQIGWYDCTISILPHIQFEGMDVELRLESRL